MMILLFFLSTMVTIGYMAQSYSAIKNRDVQLLSELKVWRTVATLFIIPMVISVVIAIGDIFHIEALGEVAKNTIDNTRIGVLNLKSSNIGYLLTIVQSILLVFISLELSHVTLGSASEKWREYLVIALVLDVVSLIVVYIVKSIDYEAYELPLGLCLLSIFSSFIIVLMARNAIEIKLKE